LRSERINKSFEMSSRVEHVFRSGRIGFNSRWVSTEQRTQNHISFGSIDMGCGMAQINRNWF